MGKFYKILYSSRRYIYKVRKIIKKCKRHKDLLLFCSSNTMESHIREYYDTIKDDIGRNVRVYLFYYDVENCYGKECIEKGIKNIIKDDNIRVINNYFQVWLKVWSLVVCADIMIPKYISNEEVSILYCNHGLHMVSLDKGESLFIYSKGNGVKDNGKNRFTVMLEPNRRYTKILQQENSYLKDVVKFVGYKYADDIRKERENYQKYRDELGFKKEDKVVSVFGTWRKDSLFHQVGKELIKQAKNIESDKYKFILSIHPREYTQYDKDIQPLGKYVEKQSKYGFLVRNPKDDFMPYLIASDIVISDYSSMYELALMAGKPVILSDFADNVVWKHSMVRKLKKNLPTFTNSSNLEELLRDVLEKKEYSYICKKYAYEIMNNEGSYKKNVIDISKKLINS